MNKRERKKLDLLIRVSKGTGNSPAFLAVLLINGRKWQDESTSSSLSEENEELMEELLAEGLIYLNGDDGNKGYAFVTPEGRKEIEILSNPLRRCILTLNKHVHEWTPLISIIALILSIIK